jgi:hypothetical protein
MSQRALNVRATAVAAKPNGTQVHVEVIRYPLKTNRYSSGGQANEGRVKKSQGRFGS